MKKMLSILLLQLLFVGTYVQANGAAEYTVYNAVKDSDNKDYGQTQYELYLKNRIKKDKVAKKIAAEALEDAANAGHEKAQEQYFNDLKYGNKYTKRKKDKKKAFSLLVKWAQEGRIWAKYESYYCYTYTNYKEAAAYRPDDSTLSQWLDDAARAGHVKAMRKKAEFYINGYYDNPKDTAKAVALYERILKCDYKELKDDFLDYEYKDSYSTLSEIIKKKPVANAFAKAKGFDAANQYALASIYYTRAAEGGNAKAMARLGDFYSKGLWVEKNQDLAIGWYRKAAKKGDRNSKAVVAKYDKEQKELAEKQAQQRTQKETQDLAQSQTAAKPKKKNKFANFMKKVGEVLDVVGSSLNEISTATSGSTANDATYTDNTTTQYTDDDSSEEYYYIPDVLNEIDGYIRIGNQNIAANQQARDKTRRNAKYSYTNIGGQLVKVVDMSRTTVYHGSGIPSGISANNNAYYTKVRQSFVRYSTLNKTDYIPVAKYNQIWEAHKQADNKARGERKAVRKDRNDRFNSKIYQNYVNMLIRHSYKDDRDFAWIRQIQDKMAGVREKCGCKKSPWETWDGIHDPF